MHGVRLAQASVIAAAQIDPQGRQWIEVIPTATEARNGPWFFTITASDLDTYAQSIRDQPGKVPIDYDHADGSTRAAGWFTGQAQVVTAGDTTPAGAAAEHDSVWAEVEWTPKARQEIADGEFRLISPEFTFHEKDTKTGLLTKAKQIVAATLTNRPFFKQLAPVAARDLLDQDTLDLLTARYDESIAQLLLDALAGNTDEIAARARQLTPTLKENDMDMKVLATSLGLPEDADETAVQAKLDELKAAAEAKPVKELELGDGKTVSADTITDLIASAAKGEQAAKELHELKVNSMLDDAVQHGKILPVQRDGYAAMANADFDNVKKLLDATPEKSFTEKGTGSTADDGTDEEKEIKAVEARFAGRDEAGREIPVTGADIHVKAMAKLKEDGVKDNDPNFTEAYLAACVAVGAE